MSEFLFEGVSTSNDQSTNQVECFIDLQDQKSKHLLETLMEINEASTNQSINIHIVPMVSPENRQSFYLLKAAIIAGLYNDKPTSQSTNRSTDQSTETKPSEDEEEKTTKSTKWTDERISQSLNQSINQSKVLEFLRYFYPQSDRFHSATHYVNKTEEDLINHCCRLLIDFFNVVEDEFDCFYGLVKSYENYLPTNQSIDDNNKNEKSHHPARLIEQMALSVCRYAMKRGIYQSPTLIINGKQVNESINQSITQSINQTNNDALKKDIQSHLEA